MTQPLAQSQSAKGRPVEAFDAGVPYLWVRHSSLPRQPKHGRLEPMPYLPPSQPQARWLVVLAQLSGAVLLAMVLISALPFLLLFAGIGAIVLFFALRQVRREVEQSPLRESFDLDPMDPTRPIDITPWHQRWIKQWNQRQR